MRWIIEKIKGLVGFVGRTIRAIAKTLIGYAKEVITNAPAIIIMTFASFGIANTLTQLNLQSVFVSVSFINEVMFVSVLSVTIVLILSTIAGQIAEQDF